MMPFLLSQTLLEPEDLEIGSAMVLFMQTLGLVLRAIEIWTFALLMSTLCQWCYRIRDVSVSILPYPY